VANGVHQLGLILGDKEAGTTIGSLLHNRRVSELLNKRLASLDCRIRDPELLVGDETRPVAELHLEEHEHPTDIREVDEGVSDVGTLLEIDAEVYEVVSAEADLIQDVLERHLSKELARLRDRRGRKDLPSRNLPGCCGA